MKPEEIIKALKPHLTEDRIKRLRDSVGSRTKHITTVLEKPYDGGNINAAMRSAEAFGFQDFHIINGPRHHKPTGRTSAGAGKWLSTHNHLGTMDCLESLKKAGYSIVSTSGEADKFIDEINFSTKTALVFGSEHAGISNELKDNSDEIVKLPIVGMVESYNLSVAVALCLFAAYNKTRELDISLDTSEQLELLADFYQRSVPHSKRILQHAR